MTKKLIWTDIHKKGKGIEPIYYFDFDLLNELGFPDTKMFSFIEEMKKMAEKEVNERGKARSRK